MSMLCSIQKTSQHSLIEEWLENNDLVTGFNEAHEGAQHS